MVQPTLLIEGLTREPALGLQMAYVAPWKRESCPVYLASAAVPKVLGPWM